MQITRITKENETYFSPFLPEVSKKTAPDLVCIGAMDDDRNVAGAMAVRVYDSYVDIISLYILPAYRRMGYGRFLVDQVAEIIISRGYESMIAELLQDEPATSFASAMGFELFKGKPQYWFSFKEYLRSPLYKRMVEGRKVKEVCSVTSCSAESKKILEREMGFCDFDPKWSTCHIRGEKLESCLLAKRRGNNIFVLILYSKSDTPTEILQHIRALTFRILEKFPEGNPIIRMTFERDEIIERFYSLLGGKEHLHQESNYIRAIKLL